MKRPIYQKPIDKVNESLAAKIIEEEWGATCTPTPNMHGVDFEAILNGNLIQVEFKKRNRRRTEFADYIISERKIKKAVAAAIKSDAVFALLVEWTDSMGYIFIDDAAMQSYKVKSGGRTDRNDPHDIEMMVQIPIKNFTVIERTTNGH